MNGTAITGATNNTLGVTAAGVYTVQTTVTGGCTSALSASFPIIVTGDLPIEPSSVTAYPNPVDSYMEISGLTGDITIAGYSM